MIDRRDFLKTSALTGIGISLGASVMGQTSGQNAAQGKELALSGWTLHTALRSPSR